jgi:protein-S-isoprenylcysteine O-methyltransferase Ste14
VCYGARVAFAITAGALVAAGVAIELWAVWVLGWGRFVDPTRPSPEPEAPALVLAGPFAVVRQPQAVGALLLFAGVAVAARNVGSAVVALLGIVVTIALARRLDRALARRHGEAHARYRRAVPLLLPRLR